MSEAEDSFDSTDDSANREASERLYNRFQAAIGPRDEESLHVEIKPRWLKSQNGELEHTQVIADTDVPQIVEDVNTLGNVYILDLTENKLVTDAAVKHLEKLKSVSELWLTWTKITESGLDSLRKALPDTDIIHDSIDEEDDEDDDDDDDDDD